MSISYHPVALHLEQQIGGATRLLAAVMELSLTGSTFPALITVGALMTTARSLSVAGILQIGLLIFGGSAMVAVILAKTDGIRRE